MREEGRGPAVPQRWVRQTRSQARRPLGSRGGDKGCRRDTDRARGAATRHGRPSDLLGGRGPGAWRPGRRSHAASTALAVPGNGSSHLLDYSPFSGPGPKRSTHIISFESHNPSRKDIGTSPEYTEKAQLAPGHLARKLPSQGPSQATGLRGRNSSFPGYTTASGARQGLGGGLPARRRRQVALSRALLPNG